MTWGATRSERLPETGFLEQLGQRVRTMRALRGMSRKVLAKVSGISERYIAQLESGKGNVSIVLLRRVSNAMGAHLEDLIPATDRRRTGPSSATSAQGDAEPDRAGQGRSLRPGNGTVARRSGRCRSPASR
jgi:XRE family aerobic/anaerobic benzoate catabolism transcriptional regulator